MIKKRNPAKSQAGIHTIKKSIGCVAKKEYLIPINQ